MDQGATASALAAIGHPGTCCWCGMMHQGICTNIKAIDYWSDGVTIKRVEFHALRLQQSSSLHLDCRRTDGRSPEYC